MKFDVQGALELRWATTDEGVIKHGQAFLAFEQQRPASEQLKDLSPTFFTRLVDAAQEAATEAGLGEAQRARAAELVRQADEQLRSLVDKLILHLKSRHANNLADLEAYGLKTTAGARGVSVQKPRDATGRRAFCLAYVDSESVVPAASQITDPPLSQLTAIAQVLRDNQAARTTQTNRRRANPARRATSRRRRPHRHPLQRPNHPRFAAVGL